MGERVDLVTFLWMNCQEQLVPVQKPVANALKKTETPVLKDGLIPPREIESWYHKPAEIYFKAKRDYYTFRVPSGDGWYLARRNHEKTISCPGVFLGENPNNGYYWIEMWEDDSHGDWLLNAVMMILQGDAVLKIGVWDGLGAARAQAPSHVPISNVMDPGFIRLYEKP